MSQEYLHSIRTFELNAVLRFFPTPAGRTVKVLEIGAGTGHQARRLVELGYDVVAIDLPSSAYANERVHPVAHYDGYNLPLPSNSVDVVFSSNVFEHVSHVHELLEETARVLAPGGIAVHVLPTPTWRLWTSLTHYGWVVCRSIAALGGRRGASRNLGAAASGQTHRPGPWAAIKVMAWPARHGERGNTLTELYYFSRIWWNATFRKAGFEPISSFSVNLFYTGSMLLAGRLSLRRRAAMSRWLGSSGRVYVLAQSAQQAE